MTNASTKELEGEIDISKLAPKSRGAHELREDLENQSLRRPDGRNLRRKGRTETLSTKTSRVTIDTIQRIAMAEGKTMVEVIEAAVAMYDRHLRGAK